MTAPNSCSCWKRWYFTLSALALLVLGGLSAESGIVHAADQPFDVVIYGGTSAGVSAAIQVRRTGKTVVLIEPGKHLGGLTVSGLGATDSGDKSAIGGISREFYQRVRKHYTQPAAWRQEQSSENRSYRESSDAMWTFEPHVAERIMLDWLAEEKVDYVLNEALNRDGGVRKSGNQIQSIQMKSGRTFSGQRFIDATYEGDLLAAAGVQYTVGRESNETYKEVLNGVQDGRAHHHQFIKPVDPYVIPGDPNSGLLPGINPGPPAADGTGDRKLQAYNYRICMTDAPENQVPFFKPEGYDPREHELLLRNCEAGDPRVPLSIVMMPNRKTDLNNNFAVSTDWIGRNHNYVEADDATRAQILKDHATYVQGFLWTLANHPRVSEEIRKSASRWGYSKDEFTDNNYFPFWCYIREGRRMIGMYVQTEQDCRRLRICEDSVGLGSYNMDSHHCQRFIDAEGHVRNEGDVQVSPRGPYAISARALLPQPEQCENLVVPVCISCSHIAYGSIRMEPVFMVLGQSAATMCCLSLDAQVPLHQVPYAQLRERLLADKQVLDVGDHSPAVLNVTAKDLPGIVLDDESGERTGQWERAGSIAGYVGEGYLHDGGKDQGQKSIKFTLPVKQPGRYQVRVSYSAAGNRATNALVKWEHDGKVVEKRVNQRMPPSKPDYFVTVGEIACRANDEVRVTISNDQADGHVIVDAVQLLPID